MEIVTILLGATVILLGYLWHKCHMSFYDYWRSRGVPCVDGALPFFGNILPLYLFLKDFPKLCEGIYGSHGGRSMVGFYRNRRPTLLLRDPELVKTVLISAFANFHTNLLVVDPELDPLLARNPFFADGEEWKKRRTYLSNALMSSKKLKVLCASVAKVCDRFGDYVEERARSSNGVYEVEAKDLFTRVTGEIVANVGFGIEGEFLTIGKPNRDSFMGTIEGMFSGSLLDDIGFFLIFFAPSLNRLLRRSFLPRRVNRFIRLATSQVIAARRINPAAARGDFIQLMLEAHTDDNGDIDQDGLAASATSFFVAGYETSAIVLLFFAYRLAANPSVQEKLRQEVLAVLANHDGELSYDSLAAMTYMDQALNETLRLDPAFGILMKRCNQEFTLVGDDGVGCVVESGTDLVVPFECLHLDPEYWRNPDVYDPERFGDEAKNDRPRTVFLPFGEGPRICVGKRFAVMQIKAAMATMMRRFVIELSPRTRTPLRLKNAPLKTVVGGLWINIRPL